MDLMTGMYRGICVDNRDPKNLGRIRVQVPQILGVSASGWAFPAWSFNETTLWPQDRLPQSGQGVWVMFDSTSPDKMIWLAAFGALPLINQPEFVEMPDFKGTLTMTLSGDPAWNTLITFNGVLGSDKGGVPNPNATVQLTGRQSGGNWQLLGTADPNASTGAWTLEHTVQLTGSVDYRAVFEGVGVYGPTSSDTISVNTPVVTFPTTLTLVMTDPSPALGKKVKFSGKLTTGGSPPVGYNVPKPNAVVNLLAKPSGGAFTGVAVGAVDGLTGDWSTEYAIGSPGSVQYQASFAAMGIFRASTSGVITVDTSVGTAVSSPVVPAISYGSGFNVSGTIKVASTGANVTAGTAELWGRWTTGPNTAFAKSVSVAVTAGTYSLTQPAVEGLGPTEWQVRYTGSSAFDAANSAAVGSTVSLPAMGSVSQGTMGYTSASFSWGAVAGAESYQYVQRVAGGSWSAPIANTARSQTATLLAADTTYEWMVRALGTTTGGTTVYTAYSASISGKTGHPAQTVAAGTSGWIYIDCWADDSYRDDTADWDQSSTMQQGYYTDSSRNYTGAAIYKGSVVKDALIAGLGTDGALKQSNGTCNACHIEMERLTAVGDYNASVDTTFYRSTSTGSSPGGAPTKSGTGVSKTLSNVAAGKTFYDIGTAHGQGMGDGTYNSIIIYKKSAAAYASFHAYRLRLTWTWPTLTKVAAVSPTWI